MTKTISTQWRVSLFVVLRIAALPVIALACAVNAHAATLSISANPASVASGAASTLTWTSTGATSCAASGVWSGVKATSGSQNVTTSNGLSTYALNCSGPAGSASNTVVIGAGATPPALYALNVSVSGSGTVTSNPSGIVCGATCSASYPSGAVVTLSAVPATGYTFSGWSGACTGTSTCTTTLSAARSVTATFAPTVTTYTLTATQGTNGTISPSGVTTVNQGASQTYTITPNSGYTIGSLLVDGASVTGASSYTFTNVQATHTVSAAFSAIVVPPVFATCSTVTYAAPSGTANNIVFTFDQPYVCGQYANGDWWVAPLTTGGTVAITAISPTQTTRSGTGNVMNGASANINSTTQQGFDADSRLSYSSSMTLSLPSVVNTTTVPITSVVKAASMATIPAGSNDTILQFSAVLTVENSAADRTTKFRPSFFGTAGKFQIDTASINTAGLGTKDFSGVTQVAAYPLSQVVTEYSYLQMDHITDYQVQWVKTYDTMPGHSGYGSYVGNLLGKALLRFASNDFNYSNATHRQALINYLQVVIDMAGAVQGGTRYPGNGGYGYSRKFPLIFAGRVLGNSTITSLASSGTFGEDQMFYTSTSIGKVLHGEVIGYGVPWFRYYWYGAETGNGSKTVRDPMGWVDGSSYDGQLGGYIGCCVVAQESYQAMAAQWLGFSSNAKMKEVLLFAQRMADHGVQHLPDPYAPYSGTGTTNYGITYGENPATPGYYFPGSGRFPSWDGEKQRYNSDAMGEALWTYWKANNDWQAPATISTLTVTPGTNQNVLNWSASSGTDHYDIYRATNSNLSNSTYLGTTTSTTYTDSGLTTGNTYGYWVVAIDAAGNVSNMSNKVSGTSI